MPCAAMEHTDSQNFSSARNSTNGVFKFIHSDTLRSGAISRDELAAVLLELDDSWTEESIDQLLCEADTSMDGELQVPQLPARRLFQLEFCRYSSPYHSEIMPVL